MPSDQIVELFNFLVMYLVFGTYHFWVLGVKLSCANLFATPGDLRWLPGVYQMEVKAPGKKPVSLCKDVLTRK